MAQTAIKRVYQQLSTHFMLLCGSKSNCERLLLYCHHRGSYIFSRKRQESYAVRRYSKDVTMTFDPAKAIGYRFPDWSFSYTTRNAILYALGVGVSTGQCDNLKFLYEGSDTFSVLPSYAIITAQKCLDFLMYGEVPGLTNVANINPAKVLHGEQYLEMHSVMPTAATLRNECFVADVLDKRSGALVLLDVNTYDDSDNKQISYNQFSIFIVGAGGFGGRKTSDRLKPSITPPSTSPECTISQTTSVDQAAFVHAECRWGPPALHIDPETAKSGGFSGPILHGLCTLGFAIRHIVQTYGNNDITKFKATKVRFSKPVYPGQTIRTNMWRDGNRVHFQCEVTETKDVVITGAYVDFHKMD
ncbi:peroxisomal multifunctional enzyme type 2-like [Amphiura filiformis]|uniref:peroxisomal multifunctional enzyme type 2-like n=1 Tax=Amphiura filiformis TaxID=82378 RepID=UPI003B22693E